MAVQLEWTRMDLRMLLLFGSREWSVEQFSELAGAGGLQLVSTRATASSFHLLQYATGEPSRH